MLEKIKFINKEKLAPAAIILTQCIYYHNNNLKISQLRLRLLSLARSYNPADSWALKLMPSSLTWLLQFPWLMTRWHLGIVPHGAEVQYCICLDVDFWLLRPLTQPTPPTLKVCLTHVLLWYIHIPVYMLYKRIEMRLSQCCCLLQWVCHAWTTGYTALQQCGSWFTHSACHNSEITSKDNLQKQGNGQKPSLTLGARPSCPNVQDATLSCHSYWLFCGIELHFCMVQ